MDAIETIEYRDFEIKIYPDEMAENPRDWDNLCTMTCFHKRYHLGDKHEYNDHDFTSWSEFLEYLNKEKHPYLIQPLFMIDHSGISINMHGFSYCDPQGWDWGQVGYIWVTRKEILREYGGKRISPKIKAIASRVMKGEVETYDDFLKGSVYGYTIDNLDSCWGYYGYDHEKSGLMESARETIDSYYDETEEMRAVANMEEVGG